MNNPIPLHQNILNLSLIELQNFLSQYNIKPFHAKQIFKWIYVSQVDGFDEMTDIKKSTRELLNMHFVIPRLKQLVCQAASDNTHKYLFQLYDGKTIESVLIPEKSHYTLCVSSQVGCAMGCKFCQTGLMGFERNLEPAEILSQIRDIRNTISSDLPLSNIVFMGMGEPLANYENILKALNIITNTVVGLKFSHRKITISTAGLVPRINDLGKDFQGNIAISLNAADNDTRNQLMPINQKYPIQELVKTLQYYPLKKRERITIEYVLFKGINDSPSDAQLLAQILKPIKSKINLIPYNNNGIKDFTRPDQTSIDTFQNILIDAHYTTMVRHSKGQDINAACGQLKSQGDVLHKN